MTARLTFSAWLAMVCAPRRVYGCPFVLWVSPDGQAWTAPWGTPLPDPHIGPETVVWVPVDVPPSDAETGE